MNIEGLVKLKIIYTSALLRSVRTLVFVFVILLFLNQLNHKLPVSLPLFVFVWFLICEIFFRFHVYLSHPYLPVNRNDKGKWTLSSSKDLLQILFSAITLQKFIYKLLKTPTVSFVLEKSAIPVEDIKVLDIPTDQIIAKAAEIVEKIGGSYITTMDALVAYLLLSEDQTKTLFNHEIKQEELLQILLWARYKFKNEEFPRPIRMNFTGEGIGEGIVNGWTPETKNYTQDFSYRDIEPFLIGREDQYRALLEALSKRENNNVLLVGEDGVGKENLVAELANDSYYSHLSGFLNHKKILQLMVGPLIAGAQDRSDLELRLESIVAEVSHARNVILYIPDFENLMGASSYAIDLSGALLPYLQSGFLPVIASMSPGNYKTYMQQNPLHEVFTLINILEPSKDIATQMLIAKTDDIENKNGVIMTYHAVLTAINLADRYEQDAVLPGSAVNLLNDAANSVAISSQSHYLGKSRQKVVLASDIEAQISLKTQVNVGAPTKEEKELLLHLEDKIHEKVIDQTQAISAIAEALRRLRSGLTTQNRPISFLFLGPTGVGKSETAKALASVYFGGEQNMIRLDMSEYSDIDGERRLLGSAPGEGNERGELTDKIHDHPFSLVLLDEFEKAHPKILDLFLQVLEDGRLTDNKGHTVTFVNSIIIATSNAGAEFVRENVVSGQKIDKVFQQKLLEYLQQNQIFRPELLNRFDDVITFTPLGPVELKQIVQLILNDIIGQMAQQDIGLSFSEVVIDKIVKEGADVEFGARPMRRYIQDNIEDLLAKAKLQDQIKRGDKIVLNVDASGQIVLTK